MKGIKVADVDNFRMHRTQSIDYVVIVKGEVTLRVGTDSVVLKQGDTVVQKGTDHTWFNHTSKECLIAAVILAAKPDKLLGNEYPPGV